MVQYLRHTLKLCAVLPLLASVSAFAADPNYTPPPLFGNQTQNQIIDLPPVPTSVPIPPPTPIAKEPIPPPTDITTIKSVPMPMATAAPPLAEKPIMADQPLRVVAEPTTSAPPTPALPLDANANTTSLEESASVSERVQNPVQGKAPMNVEVLLDHPADRVADNAKPLYTDPDGTVISSNDAPQFPATIPELLPYDEELASIEAKKDLTIPEVPKKKTRPSMKPEITKVISDKPRVAIYSRDKKTGEFRRVEQFADNRTSGQTTVYRAKTVPMNRAPSLPAIAPIQVTRDALTDHLQKPIDPIDLDDLNSAELAAAPPTTAMGSANLPLPVIDRKMAATEPATGGPMDFSGVVTMSSLFLTFNNGQTDLNPDLKTQIDKAVQPALMSNPKQALEIQAYSNPALPDAQRLALARGLAVRQYLKEKGVEPAQMTMRVLAATQTTNTPTDRVDVLFR